MMPENGLVKIQDALDCYDPVHLLLKDALLGMDVTAFLLLTKKYSIETPSFGPTPGALRAAAAEAARVVKTRFEVCVKSKEMKRKPGPRRKCKEYELPPVEVRL